MSRNIEINIDCDATCDECGKEGRCGNGLCLSCSSKAIEGKPMKSATGRAVQKRINEDIKTMSKRERTENPMRPNRTSKHLKYTFTEEEIKDLSYDLARETRELRSLNESKKEVMADFTGKIKAKEGATDRISEQVANGYEYRMVQCEIHYDTPRAGTKTIIRTDTGESWEEEMSANERQAELPLEED